MKLLDFYIANNFKIFPCKPNSKEPALFGYKEKATSDREQIAAWKEKFKNCNWGVELKRSGLVCVDVDNRHAGLEKWEAILNEHDYDSKDFKTLEQVTTSGGLHFIFKAQENKKYVGLITKGIDIKHNGYIVISPSKINDKRYLFKGKRLQINDYPVWLGSIIEKTYNTRKPKTHKAYKLGENYLLKCVEELKKFETTYDDWLKLGMALHSSTDGSDEGLELFISLSQGQSYETGDEDLAVDKWRSFGGQEGITARTIGYYIRKLGGKMPSPFFQDDLDEFKKMAEDHLEEQEKKQEQLDFEMTDFVEDEKNDCLVTRSRDTVVSHFNDLGLKYYKKGQQNKNFMTFDEQEGKSQNKFYTLVGITQLMQMYPSHYFEWTETQKSGEIKVKRELAVVTWSKSRNRNVVNRIVFKEEHDHDELNLFTGLALEPKKGDWTPIKKLILIALCNNDRRKADWFISWLAHLVQKPFERVSVVPVFISLQGAGKGLIFDYVMKQILTDLYVSVTSADAITDKFNQHLSGRTLTFLDEMTWRGNHRESGVLKNLTASPTLAVEEKFSPKYFVDNFSRYVIASNDLEAVSIEVGNRRYVVIEPSAKIARNTKFFTPIAKAIKETNVCAHFLHRLKTKDISNFNPHSILEDNFAGETAKLASNGPVASFWHEVFFQQPQRILQEDKRGRVFMSQNNIFDLFRNHLKITQSYQREFTIQKFFSHTYRFMPTIQTFKREKFEMFDTVDTRILINSLTMSRQLAKEFCHNLQLEFKTKFNEHELLVKEEIEP